MAIESNSLFNIQTKTLLGSRFDYDVSEDLKLGGTVLNLTERPLSTKVNIGDEPVNNTILGHWPSCCPCVRQSIKRNVAYPAQTPTVVAVHFATMIILTKCVSQVSQHKRD